ncbi:MAG: hypothetical protein RJA07_761 [Bacteroidota bacterium]|jgi:uncharacterized RDD family membrane protein YckC
MENQNILDQEQIINAESYINASATKRFLNYIIDLVVFYALMFLIGVVGALVDPVFVIKYAYVIAIVLLLLYYIVLEGTTSKTIGKMVTGTKVIDEEGNNISFKTALLRTLCRLIPLEAFSFFGEGARGWHDSITDTRVVNK